MVSIYSCKYKFFTAFLTFTMFFSSITHGKDLKSFSLDHNFGEIVDGYTNNSNSTIYIIEDLHSNEECQKNITKILENLHKKDNPIKFIGVEGSYSKIDVSLLKKIDKNKRNKIIKKMLKSGHITGEEIFAVENNVTLIGLEDKAIYFQNLKNLYTTLQEKPYITKQINKQLDKLNSIKTTLLSFTKNKSGIGISRFLREKQELIELDKFENIKSLYKENKIGLDTYSSYLLKKLESVNELNYTTLKNYIKVLKFEKTINLNKVKIEYSFLIKKLGSILSTKELAAIKKSKNKYLDLGLLLNKKKINYKKNYKELNNYIIYLQLLKKTNEELVLLELKKLESAVLKDILNSPDIENIIFLENYLIKLLKYIENNLSKKESEKVITLQPKYFQIIDDLGKRLRLKNVFKDNKINTAFERMQSFYKLTSLRDGIFVKNMLHNINKMENKNNGIYVMIAGGFHTLGITQILRNKGISYKVIRPKVKKLVDNSIYLKRLDETSILFNKSSSLKSINKNLNNNIKSVRVPSEFMDMLAAAMSKDTKKRTQGKLRIIGFLEELNYDRENDISDAVHLLLQYSPINLNALTADSLETIAVILSKIEKDLGIKLTFVNSESVDENTNQIKLGSEISHISRTGVITLRIVKSHAFGKFEKLLIEQNELDLLKPIYLRELKKSIIKLLLKHRNSPQVLKLLMSTLNHENLRGKIAINEINNYFRLILRGTLTKDNIDTTLKEFQNPRSLFDRINTFNAQVETEISEETLLESIQSLIRNIQADLSNIGADTVDSDIEEEDYAEEEEEEEEDDDDEDDESDNEMVFYLSDGSDDDADFDSLLDSSSGFDPDLMQPRDIFTAIGINDFESVKMFIEQRNIDVNTQDRRGLPLIYYALTTSNSKIIDYLFKMGANIVFLFPDADLENMPLSYAHSNPNTVIKQTLREHYDESIIRHIPFNTVTLLENHLILYLINRDIVLGKLTQENVSESISDGFVESFCYEYAIECRNFKVLEKLLKLGANPEHIAIKILEALEKEIFPSMHLQLLEFAIEKLILTKKVDVNITKNFGSNYSFLYFCIYPEYLKGIVQIMLHITINNLPLYLESSISKLSYESRDEHLNSIPSFEVRTLIRLKNDLDEATLRLKMRHFKEAFFLAEKAKQYIKDFKEEIWNAEIANENYSIETHIELLEFLELFLLVANGILRVVYQNMPGNYRRAIALYREPIMSLSVVGFDKLSPLPFSPISLLEIAEIWVTAIVLLSDEVFRALHNNPQGLEPTINSLAQKRRLRMLTMPIDPETKRPYFSDVQIETQDSNLTVETIEQMRKEALAQANISKAIEILTLAKSRAKLNRLHLLESAIEEDILTIEEKEERIIDSIASGEIDIRENLYFRDRLGNSLLHLAIIHNQGLVPIILQEISLLGNSTLINVANGEDVTPFILAAKMNVLEILKLLHVHGANINAQDAQNNTALHWAITIYDMDMVIYLLNIGIGLTQLNIDDGLPYILALNLYGPEDGITIAIRTKIHEIFNYARNGDLANLQRYATKENKNALMLNREQLSLLDIALQSYIKNLNKSYSMSSFTEEVLSEINEQEKNLINVLQYLIEDCNVFENCYYEKNEHQKKYFIIKKNVKLDVSSITPEIYDTLETLRTVLPEDLFMSLLKEYILLSYITERINVSVVNISMFNTSNMFDIASEKCNVFNTLIHALTYLRSINEIESVEKLNHINYYLYEIIPEFCDFFNINIPLEQFLEKFNLSNILQLLNTDTLIVQRDYNDNVLIGLNELLVLKIDPDNVLHIEKQSFEKNTLIVETVLESLKDESLDPLFYSITDPLKLGQFIGSMLNRILKLPLLQSENLRQNPIELRNTIHCLINSV